MKVLVFHIGPDRYALPLATVARVLPVMDMKRVPLAPDFVAGLIDLHGEPIPVIDLSRLAGITPAQLWIDTRIILLDYPLTSPPARLGLLAEHVAGIEQLDVATLRASGIDGPPFLGEVASIAGGMMQLVQVAGLLGPDVRTLLFPGRESA